MKTTKLFLRNVLAIFILQIVFINTMQSQNKAKLAIISMDTKGLQIDNQTMTNMVHLELEKLDVFEVFDKYDVADLIKKNGIDVNDCFGKTCQVKIGKLLNADKMITGSAEKFGNKVIFIFRLIDVKNDRIEKTDVMEFINQQEQIQIMIRICINNIIGRDNDKYLLDLLVNYDQPITSSKTTLMLNGPRVGFTYTFGELAERMQAPKDEGGYNMYPVSNLIGYQYEKQFLSSGDFQALFEVLPAINGMESGILNPSLTCMLGFRFNKSGIEFGLGPVFRFSKTAIGYYDSTNTWQLKKNLNTNDNSNHKFYEKLDSRGNYNLSSGMIFAVGKTFRSGYLNMPVNIYFSPRKEGSVIGLLVGFNVASRPKLSAEK